jgi:Ser/Thr protein kinase RdoA (MazF antagonist)
MKKTIIFFSFSHALTFGVASTAVKPLVEAIKETLNITNISLSGSVHGGDNKVFFINKENNVLGIAKCYTKRTIKEVERIYQLSEKLSQELPIPKTLGILEHDNLPVVLQSFLPGTHYSFYNSKQLSEIARSMAKIHSIKLDYQAPVVNTKEFDYFGLLKLCSCFPEYQFISKLYESINLEYLNDLPMAIIHGDISCSNILFIDNKISGIIDLDHARYSYRLTDIARAQVFFSFDSIGNVNEDNIKLFLKLYIRSNALIPEEFSNFYSHMKLLLIKMILETYYYVEVKKEVSPEIFTNSSFNQSWQLLLKKLHSIENKSSIDL